MTTRATLLSLCIAAGLGLGTTIGEASEGSELRGQLQASLESLVPATRERAAEINRDLSIRAISAADWLARGCDVPAERVAAYITPQQAHRSRIVPDRGS